MRIGLPIPLSCLEREHCLRAVLLHGLAIGVDADPDAMDALLSDDDDPPSAGVDGSPADSGPQRLWTSYVVAERNGGRLHAFDAVVAGSRTEAENRLIARHGDALPEDLELMEGFDPSLPLAEALLSPAMAEMLEQVAEDPASPLAAGLSVSVEQRFAA